MANSADLFVWKEKLSIGNALLDAEHKKLIDLVNSAEKAIRSKDGTLLYQSFSLLVDSVSVHFKNEERIARAINLSFTEHEKEHHYVEAEILEMRDELANLNGKWSESAAEHYSYFLNEWLHEHLTKETRMIKPALQIYPYDFDPVPESLPDC